MRHHDRKLKIVEEKMKTRIIGMVLGFVFIAANLNAANGDLVVNGNVTVSGSVNGIKTKIIDIGDWNMDTSISKLVLHEVDYTKIRSVSALIRDDAGWACDFDISNTAETTSKSAHVFSPTQIRLLRATAGPFDNVNYDATSYNRGWITITYVD
jgi:hypothetical protein